MAPRFRLKRHLVEFDGADRGVLTQQGRHLSDAHAQHGGAEQAVNREGIRLAMPFVPVSQNARDARTSVDRQRNAAASGRDILIHVRRQDDAGIRQLAADQPQQQWLRGRGLVRKTVQQGLQQGVIPAGQTAVRIQLCQIWPSVRLSRTGS